jgi:hypothetical protein
MTDSERDQRPTTKVQRQFPTDELGDTPVAPVDRLLALDKQPVECRVLYHRPFRIWRDISQSFKHLGGCEKCVTCRRCATRDRPRVGNNTQLVSRNQLSSVIARFCS